mmetsp:Transcript_62744/g.149715  ORF Transcript_62744/g.149715 Transcript_62744/m.149715 type:complete len:367 (-) Transcript_62744:821-1921(-)
MSVSRLIHFMPKINLCHNANQNACSWNQCKQDVHQINVGAVRPSRQGHLDHQIRAANHDARQEGGCEALDAPKEELAPIATKLTQFPPSFNGVRICYIHNWQAINFGRTVHAVVSLKGKQRSTTSHEAPTSPHILCSNIYEQYVAPVAYEHHRPRSNDDHCGLPRLAKEGLPRYTAANARQHDCRDGKEEHEASHIFLLYHDTLAPQRRSQNVQEELWERDHLSFSCRTKDCSILIEHLGLATEIAILKSTDALFIITGSPFHMSCIQNTFGGSHDVGLLINIAIAPLRCGGGSLRFSWPVARQLPTESVDCSYSLSADRLLPHLPHRCEEERLCCAIYSVPQGSELLPGSRPSDKLQIQAVPLEA